MSVGFYPRNPTPKTARLSPLHYRLKSTAAETCRLASVAVSLVGGYRRRTPLLQIFPSSYRCS
ncbi:hypothetical protein CCACVL1_21049 [Corchorus capsularis]|uniref:Uncharacterized protein n=1 Tax=Corchorus capsularis TaxID=210143 RepID=A0A1R3H8N3_COCAP|nr:hypothetical protein CCACVL1_21049 [Corchorus capsularis]